MAQPPNPSKLQQAVATNKAAQATRETRVAAANEKIAQIQSTKSGKPKGPTGPTGPAITTTTTGSTGVTAPVITYNDGIDWVAETEAEFRALGMADFGPVLTRLVQQGYKGTALTSKLEDTEEYKTRFSANAERIKKGLAPLKPSSYLAMEAGYKRLMREAGLPEGFYDTQDDFKKFIANDVSTVELKSRVDAAQLSLNNADPFYVQSLEKYYGLGPGDMLAQALDPERATPFIMRRVQAAQIGAAAARQNIDIAAASAENLLSFGVTQQQAQQGFEQVAAIAPVAQRLSQISAGAQPFGVQETTTAVLGGENSAAYKQKLQDLAQQEQSRFAGQSGVGRGSLSRGMSGQY